MHIYESKRQARLVALTMKIWTSCLNPSALVDRSPPASWSW